MRDIRGKRKPTGRTGSTGQYKMATMEGARSVDDENNGRRTGTETRHNAVEAEMEI